jgi:RNA polymerase sigma factor (sigma-70 family)
VTKPPITDESEQMILKYMHLSKGIAEKMYYSKGFRDIAMFELDDLMSAGNLGLIDACRKYDPVKCQDSEKQLTAYLRMRVMGSIIDYLRTVTWASREMHLRAKASGVPLTKMYTANGITATGGSSDAEPVPFLETIVDDGTPATNKFELEDTIEWLSRGLSPRDKKMLHSYFIESKTYLQVGNDLGCSEARAWQRIQAIIEQFRNKADRETFMDTHSDLYE